MVDGRGLPSEQGPGEFANGVVGVEGRGTKGPANSRPSGNGKPILVRGEVITQSPGIDNLHVDRNWKGRDGRLPPQAAQLPMKLRNRANEGYLSPGSAG